MKFSKVILVLGLSTALLLTGCSKIDFSKNASSLCVNAASAASKAFNGATTPTGRSIAEKAVDTAVLAGETLAGLISNNKPGIAKHIHDTLTTLRHRKSLSKAAGEGVSSLAREKKVVGASLTDLGGFCADAAKTVAK